MKKFRTTTTVALLASTALLAGCQDEEVSSQVFRTEDQCLAAQPENSTQNEWGNYCTEALAQAREEHQEMAPRYESAELCEEEFGAGQCQAGGDGGSFFMPFFMGYMMSNMLDDVGDAAGKRKYSSRPVYRQKDKAGWYTAKGSSLGIRKIGQSFQTSKSTAAKPATYKAPKVMTKTSIQKSGGFGTKATRVRSSTRSSGFSSRSTGMSRGGFSST